VCIGQPSFSSPTKALARTWINHINVPKRWRSSTPFGNIPSAGPEEVHVDLGLGGGEKEKTKDQIKKEKEAAEQERLRVEDARQRVAYVKPFLNQSTLIVGIMLAFY